MKKWRTLSRTISTLFTWSHIPFPLGTFPPLTSGGYIPHVGCWYCWHWTIKKVCALVNTRLDYANSVLHGTSDTNIKKLQRVQNSLARVVTNTRRTEHTHSILKQLHWLPIGHKNDYKIALLTYKIGTTGHPRYLSHAVRDYMLTRELRSSDLRLLAQTRMRTTTVHRAFNYAALAIWNALPYNVWTAAP